VKFEFFISKRIAKKTTGSFSASIIKIATVAVALSTFIMILAACIVNGFQNELEKKIFGFWGHIQIVDYNTNNFNDAIPVERSDTLENIFNLLPNIKSYHQFASKAGILKSKTQIEGIVLKGIGTDYDWDFLNSKIIEGKALEIRPDDTTRNIIISQILANRLQIKVGDQIKFYYIKKSTRGKKLHVQGIYHTGMEEYDKLYCFADIKQIQHLNKWNKNLISGYELFVKDLNYLDKTDEVLFKSLPLQLRSHTIKNLFPTMFDWIDLTVRNKYIILTLVIIVTAFNMMTVLLILVLERTNMIGILKALGAQDWSIQKIFIINVSYITSIGLLIGNALAIGFALIQKNTGLIKLPEKSYYLSQVPISIDIPTILLLNSIAISSILLILILPTLVVKKINAIKAIRFD